MINLDKEEFCDIYNKANKIRTNLILSCYRDLFSNKEPSALIIKTIEKDVGVSVSHSLVYYVKHLKKDIICYYNPLWRTIVKPLQKGNEVDVSVVTPVIKPNINSSENNQYQRTPRNAELPEDYVRVPNNFEQKRYHESLKNYTFNYPWHELDEDGIPIPVRVGTTRNDGLQFLSDLEVYDEIKKSYVMPDELKEFQQKNSYYFSSCIRRGFPLDKGGYHPDDKIYDYS